MDTALFIAILGLTIFLSIYPLFKTVKFKSWEKNLWKKLGKEGRILLLVGVATFGLTIWKYCRDKISEENKTGEYSAELRRLRNEINEENIDLAEKVNNGMTISLLVEMRSDLDSSLRFIFDYGKSLTNNRVSLFLQSDNSLVFRIYDRLGNIYSVPASQNFITFKKNARYFITCRVGFKDNYSFISVMLDDREVGKQEFSTMIDLSEIEWSKMNGNPNLHVGSSIDGKAPGYFLLTGLLAAELLTKKQVFQFIQNYTTFRTRIEKPNGNDSSQGINLPREMFSVGDSSMQGR